MGNNFDQGSEQRRSMADGKYMYRKPHPIHETDVLMDLSQVSYAGQFALASPDAVAEDGESVHRQNNRALDTSGRCMDNWKPWMECSSGKILLSTRGQMVT